MGLKTEYTVRQSVADRDQGVSVPSTGWTWLQLGDSDAIEIYRLLGFSTLNGLDVVATVWAGGWAA